MSPKASTILKVLLNRYHQGPVEKVASYLPDDLADDLKSAETTSHDLQPALVQPDELLNKIHYSWINPFIEKQPAELQLLYLSVIPEPQSTKISEFLHVQERKTCPSPLLKAFLLQHLYHHVYDRSVIPSQYLPKSPLSFLVELSKSELLTLIDYLGIYDLAEAIRQVVDKRYIKQLYNCLSPTKQEFLRTTLHQRERLVSKRLCLDKWNGDCGEIKQLLHRRGMLRLGVALTDQHSDLIWHICHILDTGRAQVLSQCISKEKTPGVVPALTQQVVNLKNFLKQKKSL